MESSSVLLLFLTIKEFCPHSVVFFFNLFVFETDFRTVVGSIEFVSFRGDRYFLIWMKSRGFRLGGHLLLFFEPFQEILFDCSIFLYMLTSFFEFLDSFDPSFHDFIYFVHGLLEKVLLSLLPMLIGLSQAIILTFFSLHSFFSSFLNDSWFIDGPLLCSDSMTGLKWREIGIINRSSLATSI